MVYILKLLSKWHNCIELCFCLVTMITSSWKHFPRYWPFCAGIHRSQVNSPHKGEWRGALIFDLCLKKRLSKQSRRRGVETPSRSLWRHCGDTKRQRLTRYTKQTENSFSENAFEIWGVGFGLLLWLYQQYEWKEQYFYDFFIIYVTNVFLSISGSLGFINSLTQLCIGM